MQNNLKIRCFPQLSHMGTQDGHNEINWLQFENIILIYVFSPPIFTELSTEKHHWALGRCRKYPIYNNEPHGVL